MLVGYKGRHAMIDCGEDWLGRIDRIDAPEAILVTHAHPDHAWGLKDGAPCPVYATGAAWDGMQGFPIDEPVTVVPRRPWEVAGINAEAFPVLHSTKAPAVGYRLTAGSASIFYVPDVAWIENRHEALDDVDVYIGDGATVTRSMIRKPGEEIIGHAPIRNQLTWCQKEGVRRAVFTHLGSQIVEGDERKLGPRLQALGRERGVEDVTIAFDGMVTVLR